ncbi:MAG: PaaI family thioesterase [Actinomycetales bacterium]|nr:PaaI family thioesterase [Actinomycetales bacterium]
MPMRAPNAPAPGEPIPSHYRWCFGCGSDHPTGLHMEMTAGEGLTVTGVFTVSEHHQGAPGLAHGGLLTVALDEILGSLNWLLAGPAVTGRLETDFRRPVPVGSQLFIDAEVVGVKGRKVFTRAVGRLGSPEGPVAVSAAALFIQVPLQHFVDHGAREHVQQAIEDRASGGPAWRPEGENEAFEVNP